MNFRIFEVRAQTRSWFIHSSERTLGKEVRTHVNSKGEIPSTAASDEDQTRAAVSRRTRHYQLSYSGPLHASTTMLQIETLMMAGQCPTDEQDLSTKTECDHLSGWNTKTVTCAKISPKMVNP